VVGHFNNPLPSDYLPHPFTWVYTISPTLCHM
jgi:hypothetical protein